MRKTILFLLLILGLSACELSEPPEIDLMRSTTSELSIDEYDLSREILEIFENNSIFKITEVDNLIAIVHSDGVKNYATITDHAFEVKFTVTSTNDIQNVIEAYDDNLMILSCDSLNECKWVVYTRKGNELFSMQSEVSFIDKSNGNLRSTFIENENGTYLYIEQTETNSGYQYTLMEVRKNTEEEVYRFNSDDDYIEAFFLDDGSCVFVHELEEYDVILHIEEDGTLRYQKQYSNLRGIATLDNGYLLRFSNSTQYADYFSNEIWTYDFSGYLNFREQKDTSVVFFVSTDDIEKTIEVFDDGTTSVQEKTKDNSERNFYKTIYFDEEYRWCETSDQTKLESYYIYDEHENSRYFVDFSDENGNLVWSKEYMSSINVLGFKNNLIYINVQSDSVDENIIEIYHMDGTLFDTDVNPGNILAILDDGTYIVSRNMNNSGEYLFGGSNKVLRVDKENEIIWELDAEFQNIIVNEISEGVFSVSSYGYCYFEPWLCDRFYRTYLVDVEGGLLLDLSEHQNSFPIYANDEAVYIYSSSVGDMKEDTLIVYDDQFELSNENQLLYKSSGQYFMLIDKKLAVFTFPFTSYGMYSYSSSILSGISISFPICTEKDD